MLLNEVNFLIDRFMGDRSQVALRSKLACMRVLRSSEIIRIIMITDNDNNKDNNDH